MIDGIPLGIPKVKQLGPALRHYGTSTRPIRRWCDGVERRRPTGQRSSASRQRREKVYPHISTNFDFGAASSFNRMWTLIAMVSSAEGGDWERGMMNPWRREGGGGGGGARDIFAALHLDSPTSKEVVPALRSQGESSSSSQGQAVKVESNPSRGKSSRRTAHGGVGSRVKAKGEGLFFCWRVPIPATVMYGHDPAVGAWKESGKEEETEARADEPARRHL